MINKTVQEIPVGRIIRIDDKYFYIKAQYAGRVLPGGPPAMKSFDEDALIEQALQKYPETKYFNMNSDYTTFDPDEKHEWLP
jgi:hypothetical protein